MPVSAAELLGPERLAPLPTTTAAPGGALSAEDLLGGAAPPPEIPAPVAAPPALGPEDDPQRHATTLERFLDALGIPNYAVAGAVEALLRGEDPIRGIGAGISGRTRFGDILARDGIKGPVASVLGLGLDIALDPTTYLGIGALTTAGHVARTATVGLEAARLGRRTAEAASLAAEVARVGRFGATGAEQAAAGQRAVATLFGQSITPRAFNESVFKATDQLGEFVSQSQLGQSMTRMFRTASSRVPEALRGALGARKGREAVMLRESLERFIRPVRDEVKQMAEQAGVPLDVAASIVTDATQRASIVPEALAVTRYLGQAEANEYRELLAQATERSGRAFVESGVQPASIADALPTRDLTRLREIEQKAKARAMVKRIGVVIDQAKARFGAPQLDSPTIRRAINSINAANAYAIASERKAGLKISELVGWQNYLKRAITPEGLDAVRKARPEFQGLGSREFQLEYGAQIERDPALRDLDIHQINELARAGKLKITGGKPVKEFFYSDPFIATAHRLEESAHAIATADFLKSAASVYGVAADQAPAGWKTLSTHLADDLGLRATRTVRGQKQVVRDVAFSPEVASLLDSHYERIVTPEYLQPFLRAFDKVQGIWKAWTLPIWPSYHARNLVSDAWMMTAIPGGMPVWRLPQRGAQAMHALRNAQGSVTLGNTRRTWRQLRELGEEMGVVDTGIQRELDELARNPLLEKRSVADWMTDNRFMQAAMSVGRARENAGRMAYFIERLARGEAPEHAAIEVKKRLFDYQELTDYERQILRRVFPFYSWARNNVPFQIESLLRYPGYGANYEKLRDEIGVAFGSQELGQGATPLPPFLQRGVPVPLGSNAAGIPRFFRSQNIIPLGDVSQVATPAAFAQAVVDQLSPFPKAAVETTTGLDLFRSDLVAGKFQGVEKFPGERVNVLGLPVPARISPLIDLARPVSELSRLNPGNIFGQQNVPSPFGIPARGRDTSGGERLANFLFARTYEVDPMEQQRRVSRALTDVVRQLQYQYRLALSRGDTANAEVLQRELQRLVNEPERALEIRR